MKKVIIICLLSLSASFSIAAPPDAPATTNGKPEEKPAPASNVPNTTVPVGPAQNATEKAANATATNATAANATAANNGTTPVVTLTPPASNSENTTLAPTPSTTPSNTNAVIKPNATNENATSTSDKPGTQPPITSSTTTQKPQPPVKPSDPAPTQIPLQGRSFDGASFVGGIILTLGLLAIGFMGLKYYKAQTERNYHTL